MRFYCIDMKPVEVNGYRHSSVTNILQNVFFCVLKNVHFWANYSFKALSHMLKYRALL